MTKHSAFDDLPILQKDRPIEAAAAHPLHFRPASPAPDYILDLKPLPTFLSTLLFTQQPAPSSIECFNNHLSGVVYRAFYGAEFAGNTSPNKQSSPISGAARMPIMRNPFRKNDENVRPPLSANGAERAPSSNSSKHFEDGDREPVEYKLSEINDSGVYLPPSPTEKKSFWATTSSRSTTSSSLHRCAFNENEPFSISRESFDSYRRSFDISARSPVIQPADGRQRVSLDSRTFQPPPRSSNSFHRPLQVPHTQEEDRFEDVSIDDPKPQPAKKRGIFARMLDSDDHADAAGRPTSSQEKSGPWHHLTGRKRGQSGQGAELGAIPKREATPKPDKHTEARQQTNDDAPTTSKPVNTQAPEIKVVES